MAEYDNVDAYEGLLRGQQLAVGAADVQDRTVEAAEIIMERVASHRWLPAEQTLITSSCGMNHLSREIAFGKLKAMADAERMLRGDRAGAAA
jgi:5-methyltetrahydropteroyltriglutamate--homocysteine methyltransferase